MNTIELSQQLKTLGVKKGDTLLIRADLGAIGRLSSRKRLDYIQFLVDAVGEEGTIVGLAFTGGAFLRRNKNNIFDGANKAITGAFSNVMLSYPRALRSAHPTNSFVAIGKNASFILNGHNELSGAYDPVRKVMELNGKMLLIGCVATSPGFTTSHLAEIDLGHHKKIIFPKLNTAYFKGLNGNVKLFKRTDLGGCSSTFYKLYSHYVSAECLQQGYIGNAYTLMMDAKLAYEIDYEVLQNDPKFNICNNSDCALCRARRWDNLKDVPIYFFKKLFKIIKKKYFN